MQIRPGVLFGHPGPDGAAHYRQVLINHFMADTPVDVRPWSQNLWSTVVNPGHLIVHPNVTNTLNITVTVPISPNVPVDMERITAAGGLSPTITATGHLVTIAQRHPFSDIEEGFWADDPIQFLTAGGVVSGYADGSFHPNDNVTRAQFAKMIVGAMGWSIETPATPTFYDVPQDFWAYGYIETAVAHGIITGYADSTFRPSASVTRAQVSKMAVLARAWEIVQRTNGSTFIDVTGDDWFSGYVETVNSAEVMSGYSDGTFRPYANATRAQIAKIITLSLFNEPYMNE